MNNQRVHEQIGWAVVLAVPNLLTLARIALGIAFPVIPGRWRLATLLIATATEFLDGFLARLLGTNSVTGKILDPIADKLFVGSVLVTLLFERAVKPWQLAAVMSRDIVVVIGAASLAARRGLASLQGMPPSPLGKLATAAQLLFLVAVVASGQVNVVLLVMASALSLGASIDYVRRFL
jgi:CDP-diacylglycerol--glycerol-3-phosphate 3-phosphatidyltransferase